jgi:hypothetical protein
MTPAEHGDQCAGWAEAIRRRANQAAATLALIEDNAEVIAADAGPTPHAITVLDLLDMLVSGLAPIVGAAEVARQAESRRRSLHPQEARP